MSCLNCKYYEDNIKSGDEYESLETEKPRFFCTVHQLNYYSTTKCSDNFKKHPPKCIRLWRKKLKCQCQ